MYSTMARRLALCPERFYPIPETTFRSHFTERSLQAPNCGCRPNLIYALAEIVIGSSSAIPHLSDRRIGPARPETTAIPATVGKARLAEMVPPAAIPVARRKVRSAVGCSINWNAVVRRLMIAG